MSVSSFLRRYFVFSSLVLLAAAGAACGSAQPLSPLEVLQQSHERSKDITSFWARMDLGLAGPDEQVAMTVDMETGRDGRVRTTTAIDALGEKQSFEMIIAEPYVYLEVPDRGWIRMSAQEIDGSTGQRLEAVSDPTAFYRNLFPAQEVPWELYAVKSLGREEMNGIETERLSIQLDFQEVWQHLDEGQKQRFLQTSPDPGVAMEELIERMEVKGVEVWIDDSGYSRRTTMEISFTWEGHKSLVREMSMKMDIRMFDINKEITVKLPEGYEDFETGTTPHVTPASTAAYEELLALIPDNPDTRSFFLSCTRLTLPSIA